MMASISPTACAPAEEMAFRPGSSLLDLDDLGTPNPIGHYYSAVMTSLNGTSENLADSISEVSCMTELVYGNEVMYEHQARENRISSLSSYHEEAAVPQETDTLDTEIPVKLNPLQDINGIAGVVEGLEPVTEDDPSSYDLLAPPVMQDAQYTLEKRAEVLFSKDHLQMIFLDPGLLLKFTNFLSSTRPRSIPILIYYLDALKALRAIAYSNAIARTLDPISGHDFTQETLTLTTNSGLSTKAAQAFEVLVKEDLPAYITSTFVNVVSLSIRRKVAGTMPQHLRDASEGLAEVFCLTDMSRPDNPIVFASQEFHRTTQYGMGYVIGRNCRFLQGPNTSKDSIRRLREAIQNGREHCETFLNYRRDGSPFMNLLTMAPLCDSRGKVRYFIGAQVDVSGLVKDGSSLEAFEQAIAMEMEKQRPGEPQQMEDASNRSSVQPKDEFQDLAEMLNMGELNVIRYYGGNMHSEQIEDDGCSIRSPSNRPRLLLKEPENDRPSIEIISTPDRCGRLPGVYEHYLLVRPYPSLRILFTSSTLRLPGIMQSPFMDRIGGSSRVRDELKAALTEGRNVTAKIRWVTRSNREGKDRWIHCTPLMGGNGQIGVWMIVVVDDEQTGGSIRVKRAPPVENMPPNRAAMRDHQERRHLLRHENQDFTRNLSPSLSERLVPR